MRDRNEWFKEVERAYSNLELKTVNRPYEIPVEADVVEGEDILWPSGCIRTSVPPTGWSST